MALLALGIAGCTITPPPKAVVATPPAAVNSATLDQYREAVAQRIVERNPSYVLRGKPQAMLRSLVVVSFTVDRNGHVVASSVYRTKVTTKRKVPRSPPCGVRHRCHCRRANC